MRFAADECAREICAEEEDLRKDFGTEDRALLFLGKRTMRPDGLGRHSRQADTFFCIHRAFPIMSLTYRGRGDVVELIKEGKRD